MQAKPILGRPTTLSGAQLSWLPRAEREATPQQYRFEFALWTLSLNGELIERQFGLRFARSTLGRAMASLGCTPQRSPRRANERDPVLVARWEREPYPQIAAEAKRVGARILFADETGMRSDHSAGTTWAPMARTPPGDTSGRRFILKILSALGADGHYQFTVHAGQMTAAVFAQFLVRLLHDSDRPVYHVGDRHNIQRAGAVKALVQAQDGRLKVFLLPPNSPHLNPHEQVWANVKARVAKQTATDKDDLKQKLTAALERLRNLPAMMAGLSRQARCRYILDADAAV